MKLTKNIWLQELVPKSIFAKHGPRSLRFFNGSLIMAQQKVYDELGYPSYAINDWNWGGKSDERGRRIPGHQYYRTDGTHDNGMAVDWFPVSQTWDERVERIRKYHAKIIANPKWLPSIGIFRVEAIWLADTWIHHDQLFTPGRTDVIFIDMTGRYTVRQYQEELERRNIVL